MGTPQERRMPGRLSIAAVLSALALAASADAACLNGAGGVGYRVEEIAADTPAARAGLRPGDCVIAIDRQRIASGADLDRAVARGGRSVVVRVERAGRVRQLRIVPRPLASTQAADYAPAAPRVLGIVGTERRFVLRPGTGANDIYMPPPIPPDPPQPPPPMIVN
jgi:membrane-associated protease RseP (regulator of RpoE activity)